MYEWLKKNKKINVGNDLISNERMMQKKLLIKSEVELKNLLTCVGFYKKKVHCRNS
jgi:endonuclease III-like uncharacterized protein